MRIEGTGTGKTSDGALSTPCGMRMGPRYALCFVTLHNHGTAAGISATRIVSHGSLNFYERGRRPSKFSLNMIIFST